jgi:hypothetical protein
VLFSVLMALAALVAHSSAFTTNWMPCVNSASPVPLGGSGRAGMLQALGRRDGGMPARLTMGTVKEASAEVVIGAPIEVFCLSYRSCAHHFLASFLDTSPLSHLSSHSHEQTFSLKGMHMGRRTSGKCGAISSSCQNGSRGLLKSLSTTTPLPSGPCEKRSRVDLQDVESS